MWKSRLNKSLVLPLTPSRGGYQLHPASGNSRGTRILSPSGGGWGRNYIILSFLFLPLISFSQTDEQYLAGNAYLVKGEYRKAAESLSLAISRNNSDERLFIRRGQAFLNEGDTEKAIADFSEANLISPGSANLELARAYATEGNEDEAIRYIKEHLKSPYRISEDSIKKDPAFRSLQGSAEWLSLWEQEWYTDAEKSISDARFYARKNQFDQAVSVLDNAISREPKNVKLIAERGNVFLKEGNYAAAAGDFSSAINSEKDNGDLYARRGAALLKSGKFREAVSDFNRALRNDPASFDLYLKRAEAYAGQSNFQQAIRDLQLYLRYFEKDQKAVYQCGEYYFASGDYINALKYFNINLKEDPNNALFYKARGKTYLNTATKKYALTDLSMSLDLDAGDAETWMYHGVAAIETGDKTTGCSSLRRAQHMGSKEALRFLLENGCSE